MTNDSRVVSLHGGARERSSFSLPSALIRLRDYSSQALRKELGEFFDSADDALFNLADKAGTNQDQTAYFDAMRELRLRRKAMSLSILQWVARAFNEVGTFDPQSRRSGDLTEIDQDSLSLVDHGDHEQQVAIDNLVNKLRNRYTDSIRMLAVRIEHLIPNANLSDRQMPLSPEIICGGLQEACNDLDIDIRAKLVVLKLFDKLFIDRLDRLYREANTLLVKDGVLPDMKRPPVAGRGEPRQPVARRPVPPSAPSMSGETYTPVGGEGRHPTFSELSALLHTQTGPADSSASSATGQQGVIGTVELMRRLAVLQSRSDILNAEHGAGHSEVPGGNLTRQVESMLAGRNQTMGALNQVDADVINLVTMLFDFILEDRQLPLPMKNVIGRLQIPILKVALLDRSFFNRGGHPARKLLNELAMAGIGWNEKASGQRDPLREKIESVVDRLISDFSDNVEIFSELLDEFSHFMDLDRRRRELVEQRLRDAEEGRARQQRARDAAAEVIDSLREGRHLPPVVEAILDEPWSKVLQFLYLREGEASDAWTQSVALARELVWSVDPKEVTEQTRGELLRRIPSIVDNLRKGLHSISWDPFASDAMMRDLELAHVDTLQQLAVQAPMSPSDDTATPAETMDDAAVSEAVAEFSSPQPAAEAVPETLATASPDAATEPALAQGTDGTNDAVAEPETDVDSRWLEMAQKLRVGSWVELQAEGQKLRCKLAAVIKATGKYIFVNRNGAKVAEYDQADVARALATGEVSMLDDGLIFDRALESIIDNLRHSRRD
ncbi:DUF1631 domain-containing protein [Marinobacter halodurans]|uniref:DUF1631 domain-containing protein n=1 Tax=Marinobacter halodurans TaxID=2528979 RepID=A0ABY1ZIN2_9GAMM|nr:DUF1631 domain-containing protein [Marinobacter halodurans]TBW54484.1 DUF1631 domain-containing protein [Marinobacter halodurans]